MASAEVRQGVPPLMGVTIRRSLAMGRLFLVVGMIYVVILSIVLAFTSASSFGSAIPVLLPIFAVVGAMGGLMVFSSDRIKGVLEYLLAYGVSPLQLFLNIIVACLALASLLLAISVATGVVMLLVAGHSVSAVFVELLLTYTLPMSYASVALAATVGMCWTSLSAPRSGVNSPVGLIPIVGIAPPTLTLIVLGVVESTTNIPPVAILATAVLLIVAIVAVLLRWIRRLMPRERLLSPA